MAQTADHVDVLAAGQVLVDRRVLSGQPDDAADHVGRLDDVVAEDGRRTRVRLEDGGQDAYGGGLAGAVRAEQTENGSGLDLERHAVGRSHVPRGNTLTRSCASTAGPWPDQPNANSEEYPSGKKLSAKVSSMSSRRSVWSSSSSCARRSRGLRRGELDERLAKKLKLSRTDLRCLDLIARLGPITAGRLAEETGLTTGAVTFLLDRLEEAGMVTRRRETEDRPRVWVEIVPSAHERLQGLQKPVAEEMRQVAQRFQTDELAAMRDFMRAAREVFERRVWGPGAGGGAPDDGGPRH